MHKPRTGKEQDQHRQGAYIDNVVKRVKAARLGTGPNEDEYELIQHYWDSGLDAKTAAANLTNPTPVLNEPRPRRQAFVERKKISRTTIEEIVREACNKHKKLFEKNLPKKKI